MNSSKNYLILPFQSEILRESDLNVFERNTLFLLFGLFDIIDLVLFRTVV